MKELLIAAALLLHTEYVSPRVTATIEWRQPRRGDACTALKVTQIGDPAGVFIQTGHRQSIQEAEPYCDGELLRWGDAETGWVLENNDPSKVGKATLFSNVACQEWEVYISVCSGTHPYTVELHHHDTFREDGLPSVGPLTARVGRSYIYLPLVGR